MASTVRSPPGMMNSSSSRAAKSTMSAPVARNNKVTPPQASQQLRQNDPMKVDKNVVDELLLVCGVIGTSVEQHQQQQNQQHNSATIVPVTDCINWLQDLQRALRRDDDTFRPISLLLGQWKICQHKLLPLVHSCRYDNHLVLTICKILVILTKPLSEAAQRAGRMVIDTKKDKAKNKGLIAQQMRLRENAIQQAEQRVEYKRAICQYHHGGTKKNKEGILSIFVSLLAEPLSKSGSSRTDADHLTIELVLHLFRNLLSAEPLVHSSSLAFQQSRDLHCEFVALLEEQLVLDILLVLGADIEQRENQQYNLLLMELLQHLIRHQDPAAVAKVATAIAPKVGTRGRPPLRGTQMAATGGSKKRQVKSKGILSQSLQREQRHWGGGGGSNTMGSRHGHFGGTLVLKGRTAADPQTYVSTSALVTGGSTATGGGASQPPARKNRKAEPFIDCGSTSTSGATSQAASSPAQRRAQRTLNSFCQRFVADCYGPVMKSLKNEFRRDSVRLEDGDRVVFFQIAWFFVKWWRTGHDHNQHRTATRNDKEPTSDRGSGIGQLIITMDLFSFNLVLNATDTFQQHKKYAPLAQATAMLSEMTHLLSILYHSKEETEQKIAIGLMDNLFYGSEPLDRLPKLLSAWQPGVSTRAYLSDLAEIVHVQLKLLEAHQKVCSNVDKDLAKRDTVAKKMAVAAQFDVTSYLTRRIISNQVVFMYTMLLSQYDNNEEHVTHRAIAFFLRLCNLKIVVGDDPQAVGDKPLQKFLATKTVTFAPMLYNMHMFKVMNNILVDHSIRGCKNFASLLKFATNFMYSFSQAAKANPVLFVEALFKHSLPHRYCDLVTNMYVNEDLHNLAEREMLLTEQRNFEEQVAALQKDDDDESESSEDELEFEDFNKPTTSTKTATLKKRKSIVDSDDDSDGDSDSSPPPPKRKAVMDSDDDEDDVKNDMASEQASGGASKPQQELTSSPEKQEEDSDFAERATDSPKSDNASDNPSANTSQSTERMHDDEDSSTSVGEDEGILSEANQNSETTKESSRMEMDDGKAQANDDSASIEDQEKLQTQTGLADSSKQPVEGSSDEDEFD